MPDDQRLLDELAVNATGATTFQLLDGWLLRAAPEFTFRRTNSVFPNRGYGELDDRRLATVADFYRSRRLPVRYQVSPAAQPSGLDERLAEAGYDVEAPVDILVAPLAAMVERTADARATAVVAKEVSDDWTRAFGRIHDDENIARRVEAYGRLMRSIAPPVVVATVERSGEPAGLGFGVVERGWLGVYGMGTRPDARRSGIATAVLHGLGCAAIDLGATRGYLQVEIDNAGAHALYERAAFTRAYGYHYRVRA